MSRDLRIVTVRGGVILDAAGNAVSVGDAAYIAHRNGFRREEQFVKFYEGQTLQLDGGLLVIARPCRCGHPNTNHGGGSGPCGAWNGPTRCDCREYREAMP